jgi:hypothetical protein
MPELSAKTLQTYRSTINAVYKSIGLGAAAPTDSGAWIKTNLSAIIKMIDETESKQTAKNRAVVLKIWSDMFDLPDSVIKTLEKKMYELADEVNSSYATNKMSDKIADNWASLDDLKEKVEYLKQKLPEPKYIDTYKEYIALMRYLCLLIHVHMPLRNDLADARLMEALPHEDDIDGNSNYIIINKRSLKGQIHLYAYKTRGAYGVKVLDIPKEVVREIVYYWDAIKRESYTKNAWFIKKNGVDEPITRVTYTKMLNAIFSRDDIKVSSTQIRRAVVTEVYAPDPDEYKKKQDLANVMGHSSATASLVYAKIVPKDKKDKK